MTSLELPQQEIDEAEYPLRYYADRIIRPSGKTFKIGVCPELADWNDPTGVPTQLAAQEFNLLANAGISMATAYRGPGEWDFTMADWVTNKAMSAGQSMVGMHLIWGHILHGSETAIPAWILNGGYSRAQLITLLEDHISRVMTRYKGVIGAYVVVNQKLLLYGHYDWWYQQIGPKYVEIAFRMARQTDPSAVLVYNHDENHHIGKGYSIISEVDVRQLKAQGLVDAVGMVLQVGIGPSMKAEVIAGMKRYQLPVWVTGFQCVWTPELQVARDMTEAALESGVCDYFVMRGVSDKNQVWQSSNCLWDINYNTKAEYYTVRQVLMDHMSPVSGSRISTRICSDRSVAI